MPTSELITSPANPRVKALIALRRRRIRDQERRTLVEGCEELALALDAGVVPHELYFCPELMSSSTGASEVLERATEVGAARIRMSRAAFEKAAYRQGPDGFLAVVDTPGQHCADLDGTLPPDALVLVAQGVEKPGNLGAILRTADAAGVDAVIAADPVTDWGNPNTVRASKGTVFSVPVVSDDTATVLGWLRRHGFTLLATTPDTETLHTAADYRGRVAVAVGTEKTGLTDEMLDRAQERVRIPMVGRANSLNVATSAAIVIYEAVRQRGPRG